MLRENGYDEQSGELVSPTLIPVFGVAAGSLTGERLEPRQWLGAVVIVGATVAVAWQQHRTASAHHA